MTRLAGAIVALAAVVMLTNLTSEERRLEREIIEELEASDRFVDVGVVLRTVVADGTGRELIEGKPLLRVVRERSFGGVIDTRAAPPQRVGPSVDPVYWYVSEEQEQIVLHADDLPLGLLVLGSEGAGKTTALAMWHYFRWLEHLGEGREGGQTAPTGARVDLVRDEMLKLYPSHWFRHLVALDVILFCDGTAIRLKSTKQQSSAGGSPIQGFNWSWCGRDEGQDQVERHNDIEMRGRAAKLVDGVLRYKQLITATAKQDYAWKNLRDMLVSARSKKTGRPLWLLLRLLIKKSPFVSPEFLEDKAASMSLREYQRRIEVLDLPPELAVYYAWQRSSDKGALNLAPVPPGAVDVTAHELRGLGDRITVLVGYDPGKLFDVSILLKAYKMRGWARPRWWVVGEVTTEQTTTEQHVQELLRVVGSPPYGCNLRDRHGRINGPRIAVRADPYGDTGNDNNQPDITVYRTFRNAGILIRPAQYVASAKRLKVLRIPREARIDMVNTLLCAANGERRLYVAPDERGQPVAPKLVEAFETMERTLAGDAEQQKKDRKDPTHWPCALGYGLYAIEKPRLDALRKAA